MSCSSLAMRARSLRTETSANNSRSASSSRPRSASCSAVSRRRRTHRSVCVYRVRSESTAQGFPTHPCARARAGKRHTPVLPPTPTGRKTARLSRIRTQPAPRAGSCSAPGRCTRTPRAGGQTRSTAVGKRRHQAMHSAPATVQDAPIHSPRPCRPPSTTSGITVRASAATTISCDWYRPTRRVREPCSDAAQHRQVRPYLRPAARQFQVERAGMQQRPLSGPTDGTAQVGALWNRPVDHDVERIVSERHRHADRRRGLVGQGGDQVSRRSDTPTTRRLLAAPADRLCTCRRDPPSRCRASSASR